MDVRAGTSAWGIVITPFNFPPVPDREEPLQRRPGHRAALLQPRHPHLLQAHLPARALRPAQEEGVGPLQVRTGGGRSPGGGLPAEGGAGVAADVDGRRGGIGPKVKD